MHLVKSKLILGEYIILSMNFSLQNDKSIDIGGHTQLTSGIWGYHHKQLLFSATANDIFRVADILVKIDCSGMPAVMQLSMMEK